jgi:hypothetical protein
MRVVEGPQPIASPVVESAHANAFRLMSIPIGAASTLMLVRIARVFAASGIVISAPGCGTEHG